MLTNISYFLLFGKPLIMWMGILTISSFLFTALIGYLNFKGNHAISFKWHPRLAKISVALALIHGTLGILAYF